MRSWNDDEVGGDDAAVRVRSTGITLPEVSTSLLSLYANNDFLYVFITTYDYKCVEITLWIGSSQIKISY